MMSLFQRQMSLKERELMLVLIISTDKGEHQSLEQIQAFMEGNEGVDFKCRSRKEIYE
jgi:hypothetical protein